MTKSIVRTTYVRRLIGAVLLDGAAYEEIATDPAATGQAFTTVVLSGLAMGIALRGPSGSIASVAPLAALALLSWALWSVMIFEMGTHLLPASDAHVDLGELLRTFGFASAPGCFLVLAAGRDLALPIMVVTGLWLLAAMTVAVRQALDFDSTVEAGILCAAGWGLILLAGLALGLLFGPALQ
jgi:hypothetical protein